MSISFIPVYLYIKVHSNLKFRNHIQEKWNTCKMPSRCRKIYEIRKKMPGFDTHIFSLGIPQGSQKYPYENIPCVSWREIYIFLIYVLKNARILLEKWPFSVFKWCLLKFLDNKSKIFMRYSSYSNSIDMFRHKNFENRSIFLIVVTSFPMKTAFQLNKWPNQQILTL